MLSLGDKLLGSFVTIEAKVRFMNAAWAYESMRPALIAWSKLLLGQSPDEEYTQADLMESIEKADSCDCRWAGMCLDCTRVLVSNKPAVIPRNTIHGLFKKVLRGFATRADIKRIKDNLLSLDASLDLRVRLRPAIVLDWLSGRKDLIPYLSIIVGSYKWGLGGFVTTSGLLCVIGPHLLWDEFVKKDMFSQCALCFKDSVSRFKMIARFGVSNGVMHNEDLFEWQYIHQVIGRLSGFDFQDVEEILGRTDYASLQVDNACAPFRDEFFRRYDARIALEGRRFGFLAAQSRVTSGRPFVHNNCDALVRIPTGSMPAADAPSSLSDEVPKEQHNKKFGFFYMSNAEQRKLTACVPNAISDLLGKTELATVRSLIAGPVPLYSASTVLSAYAEDRFLATLDGCPLMKSGASRLRGQVFTTCMADEGYVANRDFKDYNRCHAHARMRLFYTSMYDELTRHGEHDLAAEALFCAKCMDNVGVGHLGGFWRWTYGMQTGWRHTMLFNCTFNVCSGDIAADIARELGLGNRLVNQHQGDDSEEVYSQPFTGPFVQSLLDAAGQAGNSTKQHFAREPRAWSEFLRLRRKGNRVRGSSIRAFCSFASNDMQHAVMEGGYSQVSACVDGLNTVYLRRLGQWCLRLSDISSLCSYWALSNRQFREKTIIMDWRAYFTVGCTYGQLSMPAFPELCFEGFCKIERMQRHPLVLGDIALKRARRNLLAIATKGAEFYGAEYAKDVLQAAVEASDVVMGFEVRGEMIFTETEKQGAAYVVACALSAHAKFVFSEMDMNDRDKQVTVGLLFGGSERVGISFVRDGRFVSGNFKGALASRVHNGLSVLAGKTCAFRFGFVKKYGCPVIYWGLLNEWSVRTGLDKRVAVLIGQGVTRCGIVAGSCP